jgi:hypothetical protein
MNMTGAVLIVLPYGRVIKLELAKEAGDLHDRCIPRKPKAKKEGYLVISCTAQGNNKG